MLMLGRGGVFADGASRHFEPPEESGCFVEENAMDRPVRLFIAPKTVECWQICRSLHSA